MEVYDQIIYQLDSTLETIEAANEDKLEVYSKSIRESKQALDALRNRKEILGLQSQEREIDFFKNKKANVLSKLLYFVKLHNIELSKPNGSENALIQYYKKRIQKLQKFIDNNREFYRYYRTNSTHFDKEYYTHNKELDLKAFPETVQFYSDSTFSTSHDAMLATIMAHEDLIFQLHDEIQTLKSHATGHSKQEVKMLKWHANKNDLVELIYALHATGAIGPTHISLRKITDAFGHLFNIELGNVSRTFLELTERSQQTKFLDSLRENLRMKMQKSDEKTSK